MGRFTDELLLSMTLEEITILIDALSQAPFDNEHYDQLRKRLHDAHHYATLTYIVNHIDA